MPWLILLLAGAFEVCWAVALKQAGGFTRLGPSVLALAAMFISVALLGVAMKHLPLGTAYAVWTGVGTVGAVCVGIIWLGEAVTIMRLLSIGLIVLGLIGLKASH